MAFKEASQDNYFDHYDDYETYITTVRNITFKFVRIGRVVSCCMTSGGYGMPTNWVTYFTLPVQFRPAQNFQCAMSQPSNSTSGGARLYVGTNGAVQTYTSYGGAQSVAGGAYIAQKV